jgi:hypothetical protein
LTPYDGVNHDFMFGVGVVDKAGAAMSEAGEWLRGTPTSATSENENAAEIGRKIEFLTVNAGRENLSRCIEHP